MENILNHLFVSVEKMLGIYIVNVRREEVFVVIVDMDGGIVIEEGDIVTAFVWAIVEVLETTPHHIFHSIRKKKNLFI